MRERKHCLVAVMILVIFGCFRICVSVDFGLGNGSAHIASPNDGDLGVALGRGRRGGTVE
jgi:hypothetical protein